MFWMIILILSGQNKSVCNQNLTTSLKICNTVGVPIKEENTAYDQITMTFLGIELDTIAIDNVLKIKNNLSEIRVRRKVTVREMQSLIGLLSFPCCVVQPGIAFLRRLIDRAKGIQQSHFHNRLNKESMLDIAVWLLFIEQKNVVEANLDFGNQVAFIHGCSWDSGLRGIFFK